MNIIFIYNIITILLSPLYLIMLLLRCVNGKEDFSSFQERLGINMQNRPEGKLIWFHAASVGESIIAMNLVDRMISKYPDAKFLVTTGTISSSKMILKWLPKNVFHQFIPLDIFFVTKKFINHWRPDLTLFLESELWPSILNEASKRSNLLLINARLSDKSYKRWQNLKNVFCSVINLFNLVITQSENDLRKYKSLGCTKAINLENVKFSNKKLYVDAKQFESFSKVFSDKKLFVAASTHLEDEEVLLKIISKLKQDKIDYYPIIVLRHPNRKEEVRENCQKMGLKIRFKSEQNLPSLDDDLYIVDSFGELGLFYKLASIVFVGGSFKDLGGHNLLEPAYFDNIILLGPDMTNYRDITNQMLDKNSVIQAQNGDQLESKLRFFLDEKSVEEAKKMISNSRDFVTGKEKIVENYMMQIDKYIK